MLFFDFSIKEIDMANKLQGIEPKKIFVCKSETSNVSVRHLSQMPDIIYRFHNRLSQNRDKRFFNRKTYMLQYPNTGRGGGMRVRSVQVRILFGAPIYPFSSTKRTLAYEAKDRSLILLRDTTMVLSSKRKDTGLLIREMWVQIPRGSPNLFTIHGIETVSQLNRQSGTLLR